MQKTWTSSKICSNFDQDIFHYALEDAFVKVGKVNSVRNFRQDKQSEPTSRYLLSALKWPWWHTYTHTHTHTHTHLIIVRGAPWPTAWRCNKDTLRLNSLVQWKWFSDVTGCMKLGASSDVREPISLSAPGYGHFLTYFELKTFLFVCKKPRTQKERNPRWRIRQLHTSHTDVQHSTRAKLFFSFLHILPQF